MNRIKLEEAQKDRNAPSKAKIKGLNDSVKAFFPRNNQASLAPSKVPLGQFFQFHLVAPVSQVQKPKGLSKQTSFNEETEEMPWKAKRPQANSSALKMLGRKESAPSIQMGSGKPKGFPRMDLNSEEPPTASGIPKGSQGPLGRKQLRQTDKAENIQNSAVQSFKKSLSKIFIEKRSSMGDQTSQNYSHIKLAQNPSFKLNSSSINQLPIPKNNNYFTPSIYSKKNQACLNSPAALQRKAGAEDEGVSSGAGRRIYFQITTKKQKDGKASSKNSREFEEDSDRVSGIDESHLALVHGLKGIQTGTGAETSKKKGMNKSMIAFGDFRIGDKDRRKSGGQFGNKQADQSNFRVTAFGNGKVSGNEAISKQEEAEFEIQGSSGKKRGHHRVKSMEMRNDLVVVPPERKELAMMALEKDQNTCEKEMQYQRTDSKQMDTGNPHTKSWKSLKMSTAATTTSLTQANALTLLTRSTSSNGNKSTGVSKGLIPAECHVKTMQARKEQCRLASLIDETHKTSKRYPQTTIDFYEISKNIGKGSFGEVSLATQKLTGLPVAIKVFDKSQLKSDFKRQKIVQEVNIMKKMTHPNTIRLLEVFEDMDSVYFVMEWAEKGDLLHIMRKMNSKIPEFQAQKYFKQLLEAVESLHSQRILHRDLKLDNILIGEKNQIKLCDFGISKIMPEGDEEIKEKCGTPAYNAPEIIANKGYSGFQSDIWSLGILLFAMCSARVPFFAETVEELYQIVLKGEFEMPREFSKSLSDLILKMLVLDPKKRITLEGVKKHPWVSSGYIPDPLKTQTSSKLPECSIEIRPNLVKTLETFGFSKAYIEKSVANNVLNHAFSCYYTLYKADQHPFKTE